MMGSRALLRLALITAISFCALTKGALAQEEGTWLTLPTSEAISVLITTPHALYGGQYAVKSLYPSYNGVYRSTDLGVTWVKTSLINRGIKDMAYNNGVMYACTYYEEEGSTGIFISHDEGGSWLNIGPDYSCTKISVADERIVMGTKSNGIWTSLDGGQTFTQTLILSGSSAEIAGLHCKGELCFAGTNIKTYKSTNAGASWQEIPQLASKIAGYFAIHNNTILAATNYGLYKSTDGGESWSNYPSWGTSQLGSLVIIDGTTYIAKREASTRYQVYKSKDLGLNWESTGIVTASNIPPITGFTWLYTKPSYLFSAGFGSGVQRYAIETIRPKTFAFLGPLWENSNPNTQLQSITSYFDHSYPLLGYYLHGEPEQERATTLNFLGEKEIPPKLYYSSHDGYDFALQYGTRILAPASGSALYRYSSSGGHTITINHLNGYQTTYMHMQKEGLFTTNSDDPVQINKGNRVGLVGLTGNTSGPHLHFVVTQDKMQDGNFLDDYPGGKTDPYAWQDPAAEDPWETYIWNDSLGEHTGNESSLLWESLANNTFSYTRPTETVILENAPIKLEIPANSLPNPATINITPWTYINSAFFNTNIKALANTSFKLTALNHLKQYLPDFINPIKIIYDLSNEMLGDINVSTLSIAFFDPVSLVWESLPSTWNPVDRTLEALTTHFSEFIVFGEKTDSDPPYTELSVSGQKDGVWYTESPIITIEAHDGEGGSGVDKSFYSMDGGTTWEEYLTQTEVVKEGVYAILYKSVDSAQNYEDAKDSPLLRVDTSGGFKDEITLQGASFTIFNPQ